MGEREFDAFIGLGSNLGDRAATLARAFRDIESLPKTRGIARSSLYESAPLDADGGDYLNAVVAVATRLEPLELLRSLQTIEAAHGRERRYVNAPRTLDLDLLLYDDVRCGSAELVLPHPRLHERAFVLAPLAEIAPELRLFDGHTAVRLLRGLGHQRLVKIASP